MKLPKFEGHMSVRSYFDLLHAEGVGVNEARKIAERSAAIWRVRNAGDLEELRNATADALELLL